MKKHSFEGKGEERKGSSGGGGEGGRELGGEGGRRRGVTRGRRGNEGEGEEKRQIVDMRGGREKLRCGMKLGLVL